MQIFVKTPGFRNSNDFINKRLIKEGWEVLTTSTEEEDILELTITDLIEIYDFSLSEVKRFMQKRDSIVFSYVFTLDVDRKSHVNDIKGDLCTRFMIPLEDTRLLYNGRQLNENKTLEENRVVKEATLHLLLKLRGD